MGLNIGSRTLQFDGPFYKYIRAIDMYSQL